LGGTFIVISNF